MNLRTTVKHPIGYSGMTNIADFNLKQMSINDIKKIWWPDTPEEISQIGSAINRLGILITGIGAFQDKFLWVLISLGCTWLGHEVSEYFKIYTKKKIDDQMATVNDATNTP